MWQKSVRRTCCCSEAYQWNRVRISPVLDSPQWQSVVNLCEFLLFSYQTWDVPKSNISTWNWAEFLLILNILINYTTYFNQPFCMARSCNFYTQTIGIHTQNLLLCVILLWPVGKKKKRKILRQYGVCSALRFSFMTAFSRLQF